MLKKTITFQDLDDNTVQEEFHFHLSRADVIRLELTYKGGWVGHLERMSSGDVPDGKLIMETFEDLLRQTVGKRSVNGREFDKSPEVQSAFFNSDAYSEFLMELCTDANAGAAFVNGIMPTDMAKRLQQGQSPVPAEEMQAAAPGAAVVPPTVLPTATAPEAEETVEQKYDRLLSNPTWLATPADFAKMTPRQQQLAFARKS